MSQIIRQMDASLLWIAGTDFQGMVKEVKLGMIEAEIDEDARLGLISKKPTPIGLKPTSAEFKFTAWDKSWAEPFSNLYSPIDCTFRGALANTANLDDVYDYVVTIRGYSTQIPLGDGNPQKTSEWDAKLILLSCTQMVNGVAALSWNANTNEYVVFGKDVFKTRRAALGLA